MQYLQSWYREALLGRTNALRHTLSTYRQGGAPIEEVARRLAHSLSGFGATYGLPDLGAAAAALLEAGSDSFETQLVGLLDVLTAYVESPNHGPRILVVSDEPGSTDIVSQHLALDGYDVHLAPEISAARAIIEVEPVSLLVLDLDVDRKSGWPFLVELRANEATTHLPVIVISADSRPEVASECTTLGADEVLTMPVNPEMLTAAVGANLRRRAEWQLAAQRDALICLPNRAALEHAFERVSGQAALQQEELTVAVLQLDRLEHINEQFGRLAGDNILRAVGECLLCIRATNFVCHSGDDTFVVLLPNVGARGARRILDNVRRQVQQLTFTTPDDQPFAVTVSVGLVEERLDDGLDVCLQKANTLLERATREGGNQILCTKLVADSHNTQVLLVEDDDLIAQIVRHWLARADLTVIHHTDGVQLLDTIHDLSPSVLILDVEIPGLNGFELLATIRDDPTLDSLPVIMLTARSGEKDIIRGFDLGATDYLVKPFAPGELIARVRRVLGRGPSCE